MNDLSAGVVISIDTTSIIKLGAMIASVILLYFFLRGITK